tara:strand:+ start:576 stop:989 length:414 start_codon:yes stop_codon:yes gene_type:complete
MSVWKYNGDEKPPQDIPKFADPNMTEYDIRERIIKIENVEKAMNHVGEIYMKYDTKADELNHNDADPDVLTELLKELDRRISNCRQVGLSLENFIRELKQYHKEYNVVLEGKLVEEYKRIVQEYENGLKVDYVNIKF